MTPSSIAWRLATAAVLAALWACGPAADPAPVPVADTAKAPSRLVTETVTVHDKDLEQRVSRLELTLLERDAQVEDLQNRLEETRREVVRSMAKVQTLATRAEAASGMAEAEIALQALRTANGNSAPPSPEYGQGSQLLQLATTEFDQQNYAGALYLATEAKNAAAAGRGRVASDDRSTTRRGEVPFALPLRLQTTGRANVREGPGAGFKVLFTLETGVPIVAYSYVDQWVRIRDENDRAGWIHQTLIDRRQ
jgi:hypothetical protein